MDLVDLAPDCDRVYPDLIEMLGFRAAHQPDGRAFAFLEDGERESARVTFGELDRRARALAACLQSRLEPQSRVLIMAPSSLEFIAAFFGCLYAGMLAVTAFPPRPNRKLSRLHAIAQDAGISMVLAPAGMLEKLYFLGGEDGRLTDFDSLAVDGVDEDLAADWRKPLVDGDTPAFLQYTSGSTGSPKGVVVSHGNVLYNQQMMIAALRHLTNAVTLSWLPLFHDMGLVYNVIRPVYLGSFCVFMPPAAFTTRPLRWLEAITRYRATISGGPNFGFDLCLESATPEQLARLDLSCWRLAYNAAEPVRARTLERFAEVFARCGFRREAFYPCYGMAEATLFITGSRFGEPPVIQDFDGDVLQRHRVSRAVAGQENAWMGVGCGRPWLQERVRIVDPESCMRCPPDRVGEVWVSGPHVALGYWNNSEETEQTFGAYLADRGDGPYLRTGDLGFMHAGTLFITGRLKDVIIIHGLNHYPQDIEWTVERSHPALQPHGSAAFSVDFEGEEQLVVAAEVARTWRRKMNTGEVFDAITQAVAQQHEVQVQAIVLLKPASLPKTSSGKLQRSTCRREFLNGGLQILAQYRRQRNPWTQPELQPLLQLFSRATDGERRQLLVDYVRQQVDEVLQRETAQALSRRQPLSELGLDSLMALELTKRLSALAGVWLPATLLFNYPTIEDLSQYLAAQLAQSLSAPATLPVEAVDAGEQEPGRQLSVAEMEKAIVEELRMLEEEGS